MQRVQKGFTLIELTIAISIIAILAGVVLFNMQDARAVARDAQRQTDLQTIQAALQLYKNKYGIYPAGCEGPTTGTSPNWSGQLDSEYKCESGSTQYIVGLVPEFLPELPKDPRLNGATSGYVYTTNSDQSVYKFMVLNTMETEVIAEKNKFFRCGQDFDSTEVSCSGSGAGANPIIRCQNSPSYEDGEICERSPNSTTQTRPDANLVCTSQASYQTTIAISGGFSENNRGNTTNIKLGEEFDTEIVRCG